MEACELSILESFDLMQHHLQQFNEQLLQEKPRHWLPTSSHPPSPHQYLASLYGDIWYRDGLDGRETRNLWGLIGCSNLLLTRARAVNTYKSEFRCAIKTYKEQTGKFPDKALQKRADALAEKLNRSGLARLHLKQCYRLLPVLDHAPTQVGFSWYTSGRSIKKLTIPQAETMLLRLDINQPHIQIQMKALGHLKPGELLAQLQRQVPVMRANIVWKDQDCTKRLARNCPLPLLFPLSADKPFPNHNEPEINPPDGRQRIERNDLRIDPIPFLPSLRIHRYNHN